MKLSLIISFFLFSSLAFAKTSREERALKDYELTLQLGFDYRMTTSQAGVMYFLNADNLIGLKVGDTTSDSKKQTNVSFQYKHFTGNSFYVAGEVFYLNTLDDENWVANLFLQDEQYAHYSSMGAGVRIGNQWTWRYFTLGVDWVGVGQRVGVFRRDYADSEKTTLTLLNVMAGLSF